MQTRFSFNVDADVFIPTKFYYPPPCTTGPDVHDSSTQMGSSCIRKTSYTQGYLLSDLEEFWTANLRHVGVQTCWVFSEIKQQFQNNSISSASSSRNFNRNVRKAALNTDPLPVLLSDFISSATTSVNKICSAPNDKTNVNKLSANERKSDTLFRGNVLDSSKPLLHKGKLRQKSDKPTRLKKAILSAREDRHLQLASKEATTSRSENVEDVIPKSKAPKGLRRLSKYCDNDISLETDDLIIKLITQLANFQDRQHAKDQMKAKYKKRMVYGLRESHKKLASGLVKFVVFAADIEDVGCEGGLNDLTTSSISECTTQQVPYIFGLSRCKLGRVARKSAPVSCVGILNYQGAEQLAQALIEKKRNEDKIKEDRACEETVIPDMINDLSLSC